jgi:hypothetical protein
MHTCSSGLEGISQPSIGNELAFPQFCRHSVEFNRKLIKKGPNVQLKIDHVLNPTCLVISGPSNPKPAKLKSQRELGGRVRLINLIV